MLIKKHVVTPGIKAQDADKFPPYINYNYFLCLSFDEAINGEFD